MFSLNVIFFQTGCIIKRMLYRCPLL